MTRALRQSFLAFGFLILLGGLSGLGEARATAKSPERLNSKETSAAAAYQGYFDSADCSTIYGWAWDSTQPNSPISVDVYDGSSYLTTLQANQFRSDLPGNKNHAFNYTTPDSLKNGSGHTIHIKFAGTSTELTNSPRTITCAPPPPTISGY